MRVLLLGRYRPMVKALTRGLQDEGWTVDPADDGRAGYRQGPMGYDAILLDVVCPRDAGLALVERWRRAGLMTPVLALAAPGDMEVRPAALEGVADAVLSKPFSLEVLLSGLRALVQAHSQGRELSPLNLRAGLPRPGAGVWISALNTLEAAQDLVLHRT